MDVEHSRIRQRAFSLTWEPSEGAMGVKSADEVQCFEFDWLASDVDGHVALFSTAGGGFAPEAFLRDTDAHDAAIDVLLGSPASTRVRFAPQLGAGLRNTWLLMAERGLYTFDSDPHGAPYRLVAAPERPVRIADLPPSVGTVARQVFLPHLRLSLVQEISKEMLERNP